MRQAVFLLIVVLILVALVPAIFFRTQKVTYVTLNVGDRIEVEVADDPDERRQGLSGRDELAEGGGMLFDFGGVELSPGIWMKGMEFSIDILWLRDGQIVWIEEDAPVPDGEVIASYFPPVEATHVLELSAGFVRTHNVLLGDVLAIQAD